MVPTRLPTLLLLTGIIAFATAANDLHGQGKLDANLPIRGFAIAAPLPFFVDSFALFIENELAPRNVNVLILRVDYNYQYKTHPELRDSGHAGDWPDDFAHRVIQ